MSEPASWGLDLGQENLRIVLLRRQSGRVEVTKFSQIPYTKPLTDSTRQEQIDTIQLALASFLKTHKPQAEDNIAISFPGIEAVSVPISIPTGAQDIEERIEQHIYKKFLFPTGEAVFRYQLLAPENQDDRRIFLVSYPEKTVQTYLQAIRASGIKIQSLQPAPSALVNFFRFEFRDLKKTLIVNFRNDGTDILLGTEAGIWFRSLEEGISSLKKRLRYEFGVPLEEIDSLTEDFLRGVPRPPFTLACDEFFERIQDEIQKALDTQALHSSFSQPQKVFLVGEGSKLPGVLNHFSNRFHCWVERLEKTQRLSVQPEILAKLPGQNIHSISPAIGCALQGVGAGPQPMSFHVMQLPLPTAKPVVVEIPAEEEEPVLIPVKKRTATKVAPKKTIPRPVPNRVVKPEPEKTLAVDSSAKKKTPLLMGIGAALVMLASGAFAFRAMTDSKEAQHFLETTQTEVGNLQKQKELCLALDQTNKQAQELEAQKTSLLSLQNQGAVWEKSCATVLAAFENLKKGTEVTETNLERINRNTVQAVFHLRFEGEIQELQSLIEKSSKSFSGMQGLQVQQKSSIANATGKEFRVEMNLELQ